MGRKKNTMNISANKSPNIITRKKKKNEKLSSIKSPKIITRKKKENEKISSNKSPNIIMEENKDTEKRSSNKSPNIILRKNKENKKISSNKSPNIIMEINKDTEKISSIKSSNIIMGENKEIRKRNSYKSPNIFMEEKIKNKTISSDTSEHQAPSSSISKRNFNTTYIRSVEKPPFPDKSNSSKNTVLFSQKLKDELDLPGSEWETYRINALYDFYYQEAWLRRYEQKLKSIVKADISKVESDSAYNNQNFVVEMQRFNDMAFGEYDCPPLKIVIDAKDNSDDAYFTGILISVERKQGFMESKRIYAGAVILPLFLVKYSDKVFSKSVEFFLEDNFSCLVSPLKFSTCDLMWMLALFTPKDDQCTSVTHIEYACPYEELETIQMVIDPYTIHEVWNGIIDPSANQIHEKQVYKFIQTLEYRFFEIFKINLSQLDLKGIKTLLAIVTADHSIFLKDTEKLYFVIRHLTHLAQEIIRK